MQMVSVRGVGEGEGEGEGARVGEGEMGSAGEVALGGGTVALGVGTAGEAPEHAESRIVNR